MDTRTFSLAALLVLLALPAFAQVSIDEKPRRYLVVQADGANREWEVRPIKYSDRNGGTLQGASEGDFRLNLERWQRTGLAKRYLVQPWRDAYAKYGRGNAPEGTRFYFYAINPKAPRADNLNVVDEKRRIYWMPAAAVEFKGYPQTWVDVFEAYVTRQEGDARRQAVKDWEAKHKAIIENAANLDEGFTPEERNEFAIFYQNQFVYVRNANPKLPEIYDELAQFHRDRHNLDAELSTYLAALQAGVESPDRERFSLAVGRIFVERLRLYEDAVAYLGQARNHTQALHLLASCLITTGDYDAARTELTALIATLTAAPQDGSVVYQTDAATELGRAQYTLAELEFKLMRMKEAESAIAAIPAGNPSWDAGQVLLATMLLQRGLPARQGGEKSDAIKARDILRGLTFWKEALGYTMPQPGTAFPLNPLMARALMLHAQTEGQYTSQRPEQPGKPSAEALRFLEAAKALDPLSAEPYLAEGRLYQRIAMFREAMQAYNAGLEISPRHVLLNFAAAQLLLKAGSTLQAKEHLERCVKYEPTFYPALSSLGEIALLDIERVRTSLAIRIQAGESVDYAGEMVPPMKEAAAFFTASLQINDSQPATTLALATLQLRLAETAPLTINNRTDAESVRRAYLQKGRDLARQLIDELDRVLGKRSELLLSTEQLHAAIPSLAAYNVYAFALYSLGEHDAARKAFETHITRAAGVDNFADRNRMDEYSKSSALAYAKDWLRRIDENQRQYFDEDEFNVDSRDDHHGKWLLARVPKPDVGFAKTVFIKEGKLNFGINQTDTGVVSRIEQEQPNATLTGFEAQIVQVGENGYTRGIHLTKYSKSSGTPRPLATIMLFIDDQGAVRYETRRFKTEGAQQLEETKDSGTIDVNQYGGLPLLAEDRLNLALRRKLTPNMSDVEYFAVVNGYEIKLNVTLDDLTKKDFTNPALSMACGFFTHGFRGAKGNTQIERVKFIFDGGLSRAK